MIDKALSFEILQGVTLWYFNFGKRTKNRKWYSIIIELSTGAICFKFGSRSKTRRKVSKILCWEWKVPKVTKLLYLLLRARQELGLRILYFENKKVQDCTTLFLIEP